MRKYIFLFFVSLVAVTLAGCTTPEVRNEAPAKTDLNFSSNTKQPNAPAPQAPPVQQAPPAQATPPATPSNPLTDKKMYTTAPQMTIDTTKKYRATLKTDVGDIIVLLDAKEVPITVNNFVFLAKEKFYDDTIFHRTIKGFMIQGGDPAGTGAGGPGYKFDDEPFTGEYMRGTVAMANAGSNTNGSQFFIMHADTVLPKNYVIFGHVTVGLDVVDKIAEAPTKPGGEGSTPVTPVKVQAVTISEK